MINFNSILRPFGGQFGKISSQLSTLPLLPLVRKSLNKIVGDQQYLQIAEKVVATAKLGVNLV